MRCEETETERHKEIDPMSQSEIRINKGTKSSHRDLRQNEQQTRSSSSSTLQHLILINSLCCEYKGDNWTDFELKKFFNQTGFNLKS